MLLHSDLINERKIINGFSYINILEFFRFTDPEFYSYLMMFPTPLERLIYYYNLFNDYLKEEFE